MLFRTPPLHSALVSITVCCLLSFACTNVPPSHWYHLPLAASGLTGGIRNALAVPVTSPPFPSPLKASPERQATDFSGVPRCESVPEAPAGRPQCQNCETPVHRTSIRHRPDKNCCRLPADGCRLAINRRPSSDRHQSTAIATRAPGPLWEKNKKCLVPNRQPCARVGPRCLTDIPEATTGRRYTAARRCPPNANLAPSRCTNVCSGYPKHAPLLPSVRSGLMFGVPSQLTAKRR